MAIIVGDFFTRRHLERDTLKLIEKLHEFLILSLLMKIMNQFDNLCIFEVIRLLVNPRQLYNTDTCIVLNISLKDLILYL